MTTGCKRSPSRAGKKGLQNPEREILAQHSKVEKHFLKSDLELRHGRCLGVSGVLVMNKYQTEWRGLEARRLWGQQEWEVESGRALMRDETRRERITKQVVLRTVSKGRPLSILVV